MVLAVPETGWQSFLRSGEFQKPSRSEVERLDWLRFAGRSSKCVRPRRGCLRMPRRGKETRAEIAGPRDLCLVTLGRYDARVGSALLV